MIKTRQKIFFGNMVLIYLSHLIKLNKYMKPEFLKYLYIISALLSLYKIASAFNAFCDSPSFYNFFSLGGCISLLGFIILNILASYDTGKKEDKIIPSEYIFPGRTICFASIAACNILGAVCGIINI